VLISTPSGKFLSCTEQRAIIGAYPQATGNAQNAESRYRFQLGHCYPFADMLWWMYSFRNWLNTIIAPKAVPQTMGSVRGCDEFGWAELEFSLTLLVSGKVIIPTQFQRYVTDLNGNPNLVRRHGIGLSAILLLDG